MESLQEIQQFFTEGYLNFRPNISVDCAIFGYHSCDLHLLLVKDKAVTLWCLPGGFVKKAETLDEAATRISAERAGMDNMFLKQFKVFGDPGRSNPFGTINNDRLFELAKVKVDDKCWLTEDFVSIGFYAITDIVNATPKADFLSSECAWFPVDKLPHLGFDHDEIVREALFAMRLHLYHFPIGKNFLQQKFTLKEIKQLYEVILGKKLNASNFANKLIAQGLIVKLDEKKNIGAHRSPTYYKFDEKNYENALKVGLVLA